MATALQTQTVDLVARFPEKVTADSRAGYSGFIVNKENLVEVATALRDEFGYDLLSNVTGVDYIAENKMEVVYHAFRTTGGPGLVFKVQVERVDPIELPSMVGIWAGAEYQEREIWDLYGIKFTDHPDLRRILLWEGFEGFPLRKDYKEGFFEEEAKPFKSRWPDGKHVFAEMKNPFRDNLKFPENFDPESYQPEDEKDLYASLERVSKPLTEGEMKTDHIVVNMGPHHPSTHGVLRVAVTLNGETITGLKPVMGYLHRNHDKIGERNTFLQIIPYTDRLDYFNSMANNFGYVTTVEKLMKIPVAERAEYIRVIMAEMSRIQNHLIFVGMLINDLGSMYTPSLYAFEERELILDIFEAVSGARMMCNYFRFGGVVRDVPEDAMQKIKDLVHDRLPAKIDEMERFLNQNEVLVARLTGVKVLNAEDAIRYSVTGPVLRAAGVPYDIRRADPYSVYDRFDFDVAVRYHGDMMDNYLIRFDEMRQSLRILEQALKQIPEGPINSQKPQYQVRVPAGEAYGRVESPKGELGFYVVSNGKPNPYRYHVRAPSFVNLTALETICSGSKIADFVAQLAMLDIVMGEVDR
ncbi:MAG TPA: NADH-quinone oxidoreductase subunit D [Anaerolineae bacterium]|jgi:NADH/F420H2 dehydrogenase subunit C|nr:NADH-quinone oxidoreductase subunit D [Anaerolineae bacterium]HRJ55959.1 NADH-quinone oxidoreductase subunit D [Anaerolineales bacterium]